MSRHRDVRCMNYSDSYENYDDIYGHSVEDDYCVSPSAEQFLFDRSKQQNIASFISEPDIVEDNEDVDEGAESSKYDDADLSELERTKLVSCLESIRNIIGEAVPEADLRKKIIKANFNVEAVLDEVLSKTSPNNLSGALGDKIERAELCPGATSDKPATPIFAIPKFSFSKRRDLSEGSDVSSSLTDNFKNLKELAFNSPPSSFSSLAGLIADHTKSLSPVASKTTVTCGDGEDSFRSLADLTKDHLQNSNSLVDNVEYNTRRAMPNANFFIPNCSFKKNGDKDFHRRESDNAEKSSINTLQEKLSNVCILNQSDVPKLSDKMASKLVIGSLNEVSKVVDGIRTPSPDDWVIDLSRALKKTEFLSLDNSEKKNTRSVTHIPINVPSLEIPNEGTFANYCILPVTLNASSLKDIQLPYTKKNASWFGKTLCKTWRLRKPIIKFSEEQYGTVKRFDFSTPYVRS